ncbi:MAG: FAD/NAD(P)-binding protein [Yoonia sp.]|uniref:FAD/NAD(P)-binding protein n=1 Tax=Yoonia sp. TaxID=2212373 RepID=UPI003EF09F8B
MSASAPLKIAMIGFGPRALGALEALAAQLVDQPTTVHVDIYDPMEWTGAGPNYAPDQSDLCILNIPARIVDYQPPAFMASRIGPFLDWAEGRYDADDYPSRADIGAYLHDRYDALRQAAGDTVTVSQSPQMISGVEPQNGKWWTISDDKRNGPYDDVLLSQGQPKTSPDPQLRRWIDHAAEHDLQMSSAYPANELIRSAQNWTDETVAIRGMGLSTLDVLRMLTKGLGGTFVDGVYHPSGREPRKLLPFSLDGKPPVAKPANGVLDQRYNVSTAEIDAFTTAMTAAESCNADDALRSICDALISPICRILTEQGATATRNDVRIWLDRERTDPGSQNGLGSIDGLRADIEMAHGRTPPDIGYVAGQVWRKLQDDLRASFNVSNHADDAAIAIIGFDEAFKRYSYGPPVFAAQELLALVEQGIVSLCIADDPAVSLGPTGWHLLDGDDAMTANVMVDAVLPSPNIKNVEDELIASSHAAGYVHQRFEDMGAHTTTDGQLIGANGETVSGLCMLGRLALGSVIAVDGLNDCFGPSTTRWANGVIKRHGL